MLNKKKEGRKQNRGNEPELAAEAVGEEKPNRRQGNDSAQVPF